jgi:hypothetical protein
MGNMSLMDNYFRSKKEMSLFRHLNSQLMVFTQVLAVSSSHRSTWAQCKVPFQWKPSGTYVYNYHCSIRWWDFRIHVANFQEGTHPYGGTQWSSAFCHYGVDDWGYGVRSPIWAEVFSSTLIPDCSWAHRVSYQMCARYPFFGVKWPRSEADHSNPSNKDGEKCMELYLLSSIQFHWGESLRIQHVRARFCTLFFVVYVTPSFCLCVTTSRFQSLEGQYFKSLLLTNAEHSDHWQVE